MACGARHTLALTQRGAAFATGWNRFGQLGVGARDRASRRAATRVAGLWEPRGAQHAAERACAASAGARDTHAAAQQGAGADGGNGDAGLAGLACGGESRKLQGADAAGCGADAEKPPSMECRDSQEQAEVERGVVDLIKRCAGTAQEQLEGSAGGNLQDVRVLDVVCGWWHSLFIVEFV